MSLRATLIASSHAKALKPQGRQSIIASIQPGDLTTVVILPIEAA